MAKILSMPAGVSVPEYDVNFVVAPNATVTTPIATAPKSGALHITLECTFPSAQSVSSASFSNNKLIIGTTEYNLWDYKTTDTSSAVTKVNFEVNASVASGAAISLSNYNPSSSVSRTWTAHAEIR